MVRYLRKRFRHCIRTNHDSRRAPAAPVRKDSRAGHLGTQTFGCASGHPNFKKSGFDNLVGGGWYGLYAPSKTPTAVIEPISSASIRFLRDPGVTSKLEAIGIEATGLDPLALAAIQKADSAKWGPVIRAAGVKADD